jgi:mannan endo-1,4-beta-mannosidase
VAPDAPYFVTEDGAPWTPIGQNDNIAWLELKGLFRRRNLPEAAAYLDRLAASGVTVLRLMLECAQGRSRYIERPMGVFVPAMVQLWDDLFAMCEERSLRILLTPFDTFWTWLRWDRHPYSARNGGHLATPSRMLTCVRSRQAIKARLSFAVERWGGSGALFPAHAMGAFRLRRGGRGHALAEPPSPPAHRRHAARAEDAGRFRRADRLAALPARQPE